MIIEILKPKHKNNRKKREDIFKNVENVEIQILSLNLSNTSVQQGSF